MRSTTGWSRGVALTIAVVAQVLGPPAAAGLVAGWIDGFEGDAEQYLVLRGGQRVAVEIFTPLLEGDAIAVKSAAGLLRVAVGDGGSVTEVRSAPAPYIVGPARVPTLPTNLMRWAASWFTPWNRARQNPVVEVYVRSGRPILLPPFDGTPGRLQAGTRPLFVAWKGGKPPYRVTLGRDGADALLVSLTGLSEPRVRTHNVVLASGTYVLVVEGAEGGQDRARVIVVPPGQVPVAPDELVRSEIAPAVRSTLFAAWLASRDDGVWVYEAYQQASMVATPGSPADLLRNALERGERPTGPGG